MPEKKDPDKTKTSDQRLDQQVSEAGKIKVDIKNRKEQFFKGTAKTVSSVNDTGEFDVLSKHANFVTLIRGYVIVDKGLPSEKKFEIDSGVLAAKTDAVDVYLDF
jgi:F0F1-type ATP synthase epsilon subunit